MKLKDLKTGEQFTVEGRSTVYEKLPAIIPCKYFTKTGLQTWSFDEDTDVKQVKEVK